MRKTILFICMMILSASAIQQGFASVRKISFDADWRFHRGSVANAEQPSFNDTEWRVLNLPHDWSVEPVPIRKEGITVGPFSKINEGGFEGADIGQTLGGEGWYRKVFTLSGEDAGKLLTFYFEGICCQSEVFINGRKVYFNPYGYTSYKVDITDYCHAPGKPNTIAVRVLNTGENSRWYTGSGIYRHVWLMKTEKIHLEEWDTFVDASGLNGKNATVKLSTILHNKTEQTTAGTLQMRIFSPQGENVYSASENIDVSSEFPYSCGFTIRNPELWSVETPRLYTAEVSVLSQGKESDKIEIPFGIRTISFTAKEGFRLNGKTMKLKGGCLHHDNGLLGAAAIDRAEERKVELMKANGYNAVRCAHNQVSEYFLAVCDRLGMLVIHETFDQWQKPKRENDYSRFFDERSDDDLAASVRRDRNHPSIIMWSIGNEVEQRADEPEGDLISKRLVATIHKYDKSRFTTIAANDFWDRRHFTWDKDSYRAFQNVDVAGYNYVWQKYESDHATYPARIIYGSESYPKKAAQNWNLVEKHPYIIGDFVWTSIDYLGEAGLAHTLELAEGERNPQFMGWPWYNAWCGDIDFCGEKKPQSYYRDVLWREREISMAVRPPVAPGKKEIVNGWGWTDELLSWNWPGREGQSMRVNVYSRSPRVRLYLDNVLIGEKEIDPENYTATFEVAYKSGELKAVNVMRKKETASVTLKTTGLPASIRLTADRNRIKADKNDLSYVKIEITDKEGKVIPNATLPLKIECNGNGRIAASGNGSFADMKSFRSLTPDTFRGKAVAIIQPTNEKGSIWLAVSSEGLPQASLTIETF
jgi:beta-galactosidase